MTEYTDEDFEHDCSVAISGEGEHFDDVVGSVQRIIADRNRWRAEKSEWKMRCLTRDNECIELVAERDTLKAEVERLTEDFGYYEGNSIQHWHAKAVAYGDSTLRLAKVNATLKAEVERLTTCLTYHKEVRKYLDNRLAAAEAEVERLKADAKTRAWEAFTSLNEGQDERLAAAEKVCEVIAPLDRCPLCDVKSYKDSPACELHVALAAWEAIR